MAAHLVNPEEGRVLILNTKIAGLFNDAILHLFDNDYDPIDTSVLADFNEASFVDYAAVTPLTWAVAVIGGGGKAETVMTPVLFPVGAGGSGDIYGAYLTDSADSKVLFAARFDGAPVNHIAGIPFVVKMTISDTEDPT